MKITNDKSKKINENEFKKKLEAIENQEVW